jgi:uncharacterized membrane protein
MKFLKKKHKKKKTRKLKIQGVAQTENNKKQNLKKKMKNLGFFSSFILFF